MHHETDFQQKREKLIRAFGTTNYKTESIKIGFNSPPTDRLY